MFGLKLIYAMINFDVLEVVVENINNTLST